MLERFDTRFLVLDRCHVAFLFVPAGIQLFTLRFEFFELLLNNFQFRIVLIAFDGLAFDL